MLAVARTGRPPKHGYANHPIYGCWNDMIQRCYNKKRKSYKRYGGRGIRVCDQWHDVAVFIAWAVENGWSDGLEINRIKNDEGYRPDNCNFVTAKVNCNNRSSNVMVYIFDQDMTFAEAHSKYGLVKYETARKRFQDYGWSLLDSLTKPLERPGVR
jgi:hypothetical protein